MDPISLISSCITTTIQIKNCIDHLKDDHSDKIMLLSRAANLLTPLQTLQLLSSDNEFENRILENKRAILYQLNNVLQEVNEFKEKYDDKNKVGNMWSSLIGNYSSDIMKLNQHISNASLDLLVGITLTNEQVEIEKRLNQEQIKLEEKHVEGSVELMSSHYVKESKEDEEGDDDDAILGKGSYGITFRMKSVLDGNLYAMKVVDLKSAKKLGINKDAIISEAKLLHRISHPHIVRYFASFFSEKDRNFNIVMELLEGGTIANKIDDKSVSLEVKMEWMKQTLDALDYLHNEKKILHRDVKPQNILLTGCNRQRVKLIDLGLAIVVTSSGAGSRVGTTPYSSYEKSHGLKYDGRDDVWAVGCVWSELVTNKPLSNFGVINLDHIPESIDSKKRLIEECLRIDPVLGEAIKAMLEPYSLRLTAIQVLDFLTLHSSTSLNYSTSPTQGDVKEDEKEVALIRDKLAKTKIELFSKEENTIEEDENEENNELFKQIQLNEDDKEFVEVSIEKSTQFLSIPRFGFPSFIRLLYSKRKLFKAIKENNINLLRDAIDEGVDVNVQDVNGKTALMKACTRGNLDIVKILFVNGASTIIQDKFGYTALMFACIYRQVEIVKYLLEKGVDLETKAVIGKTAFEFAKDQNIKDLFLNKK